jgi:transposase
MAVSTPNVYPVVLTADQRERLTDITRNGHAPVKKVRHAQVLLLSDGDRPGGRLTRAQIAEQLDMHVNTVDRIRKRFVTEGEAPALDRKPRATPPNPPKIDGRVEAHLVAICCSKAPEGRTYWTLELLAAELKSRKLVTSVCVETVRKALKKTSCSLGGRHAGASRSGTGRGSSPRWKTSSTCTHKSTRPTSR